MILELLKLKSLVADRIIAGSEAVLVKAYEAKAELADKISAVKSVEAPSALTIEDIQALLEKNMGVTLQIDGKETTLVPAAAATTAIKHALAGVETTTGSVAVETAVTTDHAASLEAENAEIEAALSETILETIVVPEPSDELLAEIHGTFEDTTFTAKEVDEIISALHAPKQTITTSARDLHTYNSTMSLAKFSILQPKDDEVVLTGTFISSSVFTGCGDIECDACGEDGPDAEGSIMLHYISDEGEDRSVMSIELEPELMARLSL